MQKEHLELFKKLFRGRTDCYGFNAFCMKAPLTNEVIQEHLEGRKRIGVYPTFDNKFSYFIAIDIDDSDFSKAISYVERCKHYKLNAYIERSKSKGYHCYLFFDKPILTLHARLIVEMILEECNFTAEIFSKQDEVAREEYGNFINLPLFGADTKRGKTVFVNMSNKVVISDVTKLDKIKKNPAEKVKEIIEINNLKREERKETVAPQTKFISQLPCIKKMLEGGLKEGDGRNIVCFRLAIHYKEKGLTDTDIFALMDIWNRKNIEPIKSKELLNTIQSVLKGKYKGVGCEDTIVQQFCDKGNCPLIQAKERKKLIEEGVILLTYRDRPNNIMIFGKKDYEFRLTNINFAKDGRFKALLTLSRSKKIVYKDFVSLEGAKGRKQFARAAKDTEIDVDLIKVDELVKKQIIKEIEEDSTVPKQLYVMTENEKKEAMDFLEKNPDLLYQVVKATNEMGVVGENPMRCMVYLCFTSRITMDPISLTVKGESSSGKSFVCQCVKRLIPEEGYKFMTRATQQAFYHLEEDGMQHRIFYINELPGSQSADYSIRSAQSEGDLILLITKKNMQTGDLETTEKRVKGPVGFLVTTTEANIFDENETRNFSIYTDDSPKLTQRIGEITIRKSLGEKFNLAEHKLNLFKNFQRLLNAEFKVVIPYANEIFGRFPDKPVRVRRDRERFRALIEIVTLLHQFHRKQTKDKDNRMILEATLADYYLAKLVGGETLLHTIYEIGPASKTIWSAILDMKQKFEMESQAPSAKFTFKYKDISNYLDWKNDKTKKWTLSLKQIGLIEYSEDAGQGGRGKASVYQVSSGGKQQSEVLDTLFLPSVEELWEKFPCGKELFYNPFTGEVIDPLTADMPLAIKLEEEV